MPKKPNSLVLPFLRVNRASGVPLEDQVYALVRDAIRRGILRDGLKLPSTRQLAIQAGVARNTVTAAFQRLATEGWVDARSGSGTFVVARRIESSAAGRQSVPISRWARSAVAQRREFRQPVAGRDESFPWQLWRSLVSTGWRRAQDDQFMAAEQGGLLALRAAIAEHVAILRGIVCTPDDVVVTNGAAETAIAVARLVTDPGDTVVLDCSDDTLEGGYRSIGLTCREAAVDADGLDVESIAPPPRLLYLRPSNEGLQGAQMTAGRRHLVMEWAKKHGTAIIEHDFDALVDPAWRPVPAIKAIDSRGVVTFIGAFDSAILPPVRIGFAIMPRPLGDCYAAIDAFRSLLPPLPDQIALATFIARGHLARHLRQLRRTCEERRAVLLHELMRQLAGAVVSVRSDVGLQLVIRLADDLDVVDVAVAAAERGVPVARVQANEQSVVLSYRGVPSRAMAGLVSRMAAAIGGCRAREDANDAAAMNA